MDNNFKGLKFWIQLLGSVSFKDLSFTLFYIDSLYLGITVLNASWKRPPQFSSCSEVQMNGAILEGWGEFGQVTEKKPCLPWSGLKVFKVKFDRISKDLWVAASPNSLGPFQGDSLREENVLIFQWPCILMVIHIFPYHRVSPTQHVMEFGANGLLLWRGVDWQPPPFVVSTTRRYNCGRKSLGTTCIRTRSW